MAKNLKISNQDIDDLMVTALEGGINYWCRKAEIIEFPENGEEIIASDVISRGGKLKLYDAESREIWKLDREKFIKGVKKGLEWGEFADVEELMDAHDAETADVIIQFALFDEIVYG